MSDSSDSSPAQEPLDGPSPKSGGWASRPVLVVALILSIGAAYGGWRWFGGGPSAVRPIQADIRNADLVALIDEHIGKVEEARQDDQAHGELGLVYEANDMWVEASRCFANAAALNPDDPIWLHHQALAWWKNGDLATADELLRENLTRHPDFAPSLHRRGHAQLQDNQLDEAFGSFERFIQLVPDWPHGYVGLAEVRIRQQAYGPAVELLERALAMPGDIKSAHYLLGQAYRALGRSDEAQVELVLGVDAQVEYWPDQASVSLGQYGRGVAAKRAQSQQMILAGQPLQAATVLKGILAELPDDTRAMNDLAYAYNLLGRFPDSLALLRRAEAIDDNALTHMNLSATLLALNRRAEALASALQAVKLAPTRGDAYVAEARVRIVLEQFPEARTALETALRLKGQDPQAQALLGGVFMKLEAFDLAKQTIKQASESMANNPAVFVDLFEVCLEMGDLQEAAKALERLGQIVPGHPVLKELTEKLQAAGETP